MIDYADEIIAALVLCLAAAYSVWTIWGWRGAQKLRREIESLNAQGRQILTVVGQPDEGKNVNT